MTETRKVNLLMDQKIASWVRINDRLAEVERQRETERVQMVCAETGRPGSNR